MYLCAVVWGKFQNKPTLLKSTRKIELTSGGLKVVFSDFSTAVTPAELLSQLGTVWSFYPF